MLKEGHIFLFGIGCKGKERVVGGDVLTDLVLLFLQSDMEGATCRCHKLQPYST